MSKTFRPWDVDQAWLLPPSVRELVPEDHVVHFVRELAREELDLSAILGAYKEERGYPPYHPVMMTALLLYAYTQGVFSSRKIARACEERVDFMAVTAMQTPDHRTVCEFRRRHLDALAGLFGQVLHLCQRAGLVKLGHVALDGTKVKANASKHKAMSYERMLKAEPELAAEVQRWFQRAGEEDAAEDVQHGRERRGDVLPTWAVSKQRRLEKLREARAAIEAEAKAEAEARAADKAAAEKARAEGSPAPAPTVKHPKHHIDGTPNAKAQRNFTDPESKLLRTRDTYVQGYNAQVAVDSSSQVIVAQMLMREQNDVHALGPMLRLIKAFTGKQARELSADTGYCSEDNLRLLVRHHVRGYVATGRIKHGSGEISNALGRTPGTRTYAMRQRLARAGHRSRYRLRKQVVEPVIGQIKSAMGFAHFHLRGVWKTAREWGLVCAAHNLRKLAKAVLPALSSYPRSR